MNRVTRAVLHAELMWLVGVLIAALPILWEFAEITLTLGISAAWRTHYKDFLIYAAVIAGIGIVDAWDTTRLSRPHGLTPYLAGVLLLALLITFAGAFFYFSRATPTTPPPQAGPTIIILAILLSGIAKLTAEFARIMHDFADPRYGN